MDVTTLLNIYQALEWGTFGLNVVIFLSVAALAFSLGRQSKLRCFAWIGSGALMNLFLSISYQTVLRVLEPNSSDSVFLSTLSLVLTSLANGFFLFGFADLARHLRASWSATEASSAASERAV